MNLNRHLRRALVVAATTVAVTVGAVGATEATTSTPPAAMVGDTVELNDGSRARVDLVTPHAPPLDEFTTPQPGTTFTRISVEVCAGSDGFSANPSRFTGFLDYHNMHVDAVPGGGDFHPVDLAPFGCTAGFIDFQVPDGMPLSSVKLSGADFNEVAQFNTAGSARVDMPLVAAGRPAASTLGEVVQLAGGATAVVHRVTPGVVPRNKSVALGDDEQFIEADVELCAGGEPYGVNAQYWLATMIDNYTAGEELGAGTLPTIEVAPSQCVAGTVAFRVATTQTPAYILLTDPQSKEIGRWAAQ